MLQPFLSPPSLFFAGPPSFPVRRKSSKKRKEVANLCKSRVSLLKKINSTISIHGKVVHYSTWCLLTREEPERGLQVKRNSIIPPFPARQKGKSKDIESIFLIRLGGKTRLRHKFLLSLLFFTANKDMTKRGSRKSKSRQMKVESFLECHTCLAFPELEY